MTPALLTRVSKSPQFGHGGRHCRLGLCLVGDVGFNHQRGLLAAHPLGERLEPITAAGHKGHPRSLLSQRNRGRFTDAAAGAGDKRDRPFQPLAHELPPSSSRPGPG